MGAKAHGTEGFSFCTKNLGIIYRIGLTHFPRKGRSEARCTRTTKVRSRSGKNDVNQTKNRGRAAAPELGNPSQESSRGSETVVMQTGGL